MSASLFVTSVSPLNLIGKRLNTCSQKELERRGQAVLRGFKRMLRDDASIQKRWDCRKRLRLEKSLQNFGSADKSRKI